MHVSVCFRVASSPQFLCTVGLHTHRRMALLCGLVLALFLKTYNLNNTNTLIETVIQSFKGGMTKFDVSSKSHFNCDSLCFGNLVERGGPSGKAGTDKADDREEGPFLEHERVTGLNWLTEEKAFQAGGRDEQRDLQV